MVRQLLGVALLTLVAGACSSAPLDPPGEQSSHVNESDLGSVSIPLTTKNGDVAYRLNQATFTITGPALGAKPRTIKPLADVAIHTEALPVGSYSIQLEKGWVLEKMGAAEKAFTAVNAQLITPNPTTFDVTGKVVADAFFGFVTTNGDVALGSGSVNVRIGVQDCSAYDAYTAQLGALTADCLGTLDPRAYGVSKDGLLTPNFTACRDGSKTKLVKIRQLLSLQQRTVRLPFAKQCLAGRFEVAQAKFANSGVTSCPEWKKVRDVNPITVDTIVKVEAGLPELPAADTGQPLRVLELLKQNSLYSVSGQATGQKCETPAQCATICAAAFPGFVIGTNDANTLLTDPIAWLLDTTYDKSTSDPYLRATYYHAMSYYGGAPGVVFGDPVRAQPCTGVECPPELCSYYAGSHIKTRMQLDCLVPDDPETCASYCGPPLP